MIPTLETERLRLRAPRAEDFDAYAEYGASARSHGVGGPFARSASFMRFCALHGHWAIRGYGRWLVADRATDAALGVVGPYYPDGWPEPEIAWTVFANAEGRGVAFEAAQAARAWAYATLGWTTAISCVSPDNARSIALARRLGCVEDGLFAHADGFDLHIYRHPAPEALR